MWVWHISAGAPQDQRHQFSLELEVQKVVSCLVWMLVIKLRSYVRAIHIFNVLKEEV